MSINPQAYTTLAKKLAAVRATLNDDERAVLDRIVETANLTGDIDVEAHRFAVPRSDDGTEIRTPAEDDGLSRFNVPKSDDGLDVEGHRFNVPRNDDGTEIRVPGEGSGLSRFNVPKSDDGLDVEGHRFTVPRNDDGAEIRVPGEGTANKFRLTYFESAATNDYDVDAE